MNAHEKKLKRAQKKFARKMLIRSLFPDWFLSLIKRRQISPRKIRNFLQQEHPEIVEPTRHSSIAVVVPCFGHAQHLKPMFDSITRQTRRPDQVIIIDDASPDETGKILRSFIEDYRHGTTNPISITLLENETNLGQAETLNRAIRLADTDLVTIVNDDDCLMDDTLELVTKLFGQHPELALIGGNNVNFSDTRELAKTDRSIKDRLKAEDMKLKIISPLDAQKFENYCDLNMTHTGSTFVRLRAQRVGLYRAKKDRLIPYSDRDFQIRINLLYPVAHVNVPVCFWRNNSSVDDVKNS